MKYQLLGACAVAICCTAAPAFAQGLSGVEVLALQQQLRDDGCGVTRITGHLDAATRSAVKKCRSKYSGATTPSSMLTAMNIGFGNGATVPTMANARAAGGGRMSAGGRSGMNETSGRRGTSMMRRDGMMRRDSMMQRNGMMRRDSMMQRNGMMRRGTSMKRPRDTSTMPRHTPNMPKHDTMPPMPKRGTKPNTL
ncbi:MAG: peptidoglycan-binding domain-containing protein [Gemmatimonadaceae bacterium]